MIPKRSSSWPAGGSYYYLPGARFSFWPLHLDESSTGGAHCLSPDPGNITLESQQSSRFLWGGFSTPVQFRAGKNYQSGLHRKISIRDDDFYRQIRWVQQQPHKAWETWATASDLAVGLASARFGYFRTASAVGYPHGSCISSASNFRYRDWMGTVANTPSPLAAVRTKCALHPCSSQNVTEFEVKQIEFMPDAYNLTGLEVPSAI